MRDFRDGALRYATLSTFWLVGGVVEGARAKRTISTFHFHFHFSSAPYSRAARRGPAVECIRTVHLHSAAVLPKEVLWSTRLPVVKCIRRVHLHHAASPPE